MFKRPAVPYAFQRRDFVVARTAPRLQRQIRVGADRLRQDVVLSLVLFGNGEAIRRRQLVTGVKRRRVTPGAALLLEDFLATMGERVELIRVGRRLQRIEVERQRVKLLVAVSLLRGRVGPQVKVLSRGTEAIETGQRVPPPDLAPHTASCPPASGGVAVPCDQGIYDLSRRSGQALAQGKADSCGAAG